MAFQLHIRQNLDTAGGAFRRGEVREFDTPRIVVGADEACECSFGDDAFSPRHIIIEQTPAEQVRRGTPESATVTPVDDAVTYLNGDRLKQRESLRSGDELRIGQWTIHFQKLYAQTGRTSRFGLLSAVAKGLIVLILALEVAVVTWLPRRIYQAAMWDNELARQRVSRLLDDLRRDNRGAESASDFERALRQAIGRELGDRAQTVAEHGEQLTSEQNRLLYSELTDFQEILQEVSDGTLLPPRPKIDLDAAVQTLLGAHGNGTESNE